MARRLIPSLIASCLAPCLLSAVEYEGTFEGKADGNVSSDAALGSLSLSFNFKAQFNLSHFGGPLQDLKFVWHFDDRDGFGGSTISNPLGTNLDSSMPARDIEPSVRAKIQLYDVIVRIEGVAVDSGQRLYIDFDAGVPGAEKVQNYNVSGIPKWGELFYENSAEYTWFDYKNGSKPHRNYISEAAAKNVMRTGFKPTGAKVIKARWNLNAFRSWYSQNYGTERRKALDGAAWGLIRATYAIQDTTDESVRKSLEQDDDSEAVRQRLMEGSRDAMRTSLHGRLWGLTDSIFVKKHTLDPLEKFIAKLRGGIPPQFRIPEREKAYQEALKSIGDSLDAELKEIAARHPASNPECDAWVQAKNKELKSRPQQKPAAEFTTNSLGMRFVPVPGTRVLFSVWETRVQDYEAYVRATKHYWWYKPEFDQDPTHPVVNLDWFAAKLFCKWLSEKEGRVYRLPTDREWSVAVGLAELEDASASPESLRSKVADVYPWGSNPPSPQDGNYDGSDDGYKNTAPVGSYSANSLGIYDLGGNAEEWCLDPIGYRKQYNVLRGASWDGGSALSSYRSGEYPYNRQVSVGFRCVLEVGGH
jgi:formylglycine-generating enzyme required for sulfatase activity